MGRKHVLSIMVMVNEKFNEVWWGGLLMINIIKLMNLSTYL